MMKINKIIKHIYSLQSYVAEKNSRDQTNEEVLGIVQESRGLLKNNREPQKNDEFQH